MPIICNWIKDENGIEQPETIIICNKCGRIIESGYMADLQNNTVVCDLHYGKKKDVK